MEEESYLIIITIDKTFQFLKTTLNSWKHAFKSCR